MKLSKRREKILQTLNMKKLDDILYYYPSRYENNSLSDLNDLRVNDRVVIDGEIISAIKTFRFGRKTISSFELIKKDKIFKMTIYNRPYINMQVSMNDRLVVIGKYKGNYKVDVINYYTKDVSEVLGIKPVYPLKADLKQHELIKLINYAFKNVDIIDKLNDKLLILHGLVNLKTALLNIHNPNSNLDLKKALARLKYEEFLRFYLYLGLNNKKELKQAKQYNKDKLEALIGSLAFDLSYDQKASLEDILNDLNSNQIMYRLLEGEVGSGKTIVAILSLYANYLSGHKGCLLAPTEILAIQHYEEIKTYLEPLGLRVLVLYSSLKASKTTKDDLAKGHYDIIVGTHALFGEKVSIKDLSYIITDEQHRFGVKQRQALREKGIKPDILLMSATPIPRTLASVLYGDMAISYIKSMPKGRKGCDTYLIKENSIRSIIDELKINLQRGKQLYIIASAIEENELVKDINRLFKSLSEVFKDYQLGLLHGKLKSEAKQAVMHAFNEGDTDILLATTVVEVGINVKNATMMVIYDADRYGLSTLHQLRGRVQRSNERGKCYLLSDNKEAYQRLEILAKYNDGFYIAEEDLKLRGPGDILGVRQSGLPSFVLGNIFEDNKIITAAKKDVKMILENPQDYQELIEDVLAMDNNLI